MTARPPIQRLSTRFIKVDLHVHSAMDPVDNLPLDIPSTIELAAHHGFHAIALTHHDLYLLETTEVLEASERFGVTVLPGIEATLDNGAHVIVINADPDVESVRTMEELAEYRRPEHLVIAAHPFYRPSGLGLELLERWVDVIDAVEWSHFWSRFVFRRPNERARKFCREHRKPMVGTGDVHMPDQMNTTYTLVEADNDVDSICEAVRAGRVQVFSEPLSVPRMASIIARLMVFSRLRRRQPIRGCIAEPISEPHAHGAQQQAVR